MKWVRLDIRRPDVFEWFFVKNHEKQMYFGRLVFADGESRQPALLVVGRNHETEIFRNEKFHYFEWLDEEESNAD